MSRQSGCASLKEYPVLVEFGQCKVTCTTKGSRFWPRSKPRVTLLPAQHIQISFEQRGDGEEKL